jgi:hypothetical protein
VRLLREEMYANARSMKTKYGGGRTELFHTILHLLHRTYLSRRLQLDFTSSTSAVDTFVGESCPYERSGGMGVGMGRRNGRRVVVGQWSFGWELGASSPVLVVMGRIAAVLSEHAVWGSLHLHRG